MNIDPNTIDAATDTPAPSKKLETPETDPLASKWAERIEAARKHSEKFHKRIKHNRKLVAGFDWSKNPDDPDFYTLRANLIHGTITAVLPNIYARNPEISAVPLYKAPQLKLFCQTLQTVTNRHMELAGLKAKAKMTVRSALTCSYGVVKVMYQRDLEQDPIVMSRINDTQDNIRTVEGLLAQLEDPDARGEQEARMAELQETMAALNEQVEVVAAEGLVIDRVLTENLLIDPTVCEFWDYKDAGWMAQVIPMTRADAEATYSMKLDGAKAYRDNQTGARTEGRLASGGQDTAKDDEQIAILEIWDKTSQRIYTMADGCKFWLREPYSPPRAGERWYPFFLLPFQLVDGLFIAPSLVDLTERLQKEHNDARDKFNKHRDLNKPGYIAGEDVTEKTLKRFTDSELGEVTVVDTGGKPLQQVIQPRQHPPVDPMMYDTGAVRHDWEQVTGMQDAARSTVVQPKTATEASIMQQSLAGRVSEFRDQVEDWLQDVAQYAAQILLFELTPQQVERIMGPHTMGEVPDPMTGLPMQAVTEPSYDWPELSREEIFDMVEMKIRAGTTGAPDKLEQQESWGKVLPIIQSLVQAIMQIRATGGDADPVVALLRETLNRFDDKLDVEQFIPKAPVMPAMPGAPGGAPGGLPPQLANLIQNAQGAASPGMPA